MDIIIEFMIVDIVWNIIFVVKYLGFGFGFDVFSVGSNIICGDIVLDEIIIIIVFIEGDKGVVEFVFGVLVDV